MGNNRGRHTDTHMHKLTRKENANMHIFSAHTHTQTWAHIQERKFKGRETWDRFLKLIRTDHMTLLGAL